MPKKAKEPETQSEEGWEEVGNFWDDMFLFEKPGEFITGIYLTSIDNVGVNASMVHVIEVDDDRIGIWGGAILDDRFARIQEGWKVAVKYIGDETSRSSGMTFRNFKVMAMKTDTVSTPSRPKTKSTPPNDDIPF